MDLTYQVYHVCRDRSDSIESLNRTVGLLENLYGQIERFSHNNKTLITLRDNVEELLLSGVRLDRESSLDDIEDFLREAEKSMFDCRKVLRSNM